MFTTINPAVVAAMFLFTRMVSGAGSGAVFELLDWHDTLAASAIKIKKYFIVNIFFFKY
jgi:hypothetical protein